MSFVSEAFLRLSELPPPFNPSVTARLQVELVGPVLHVSPVALLLPCLEVVVARVHLAHPLTRRGDHNTSVVLQDLFHGALRDPRAVLGTTVGLVPPSRPPPGVSGG